MVADEHEWIARTVPVDEFTVDVGFLIVDEFYFGDPNDSEELQSGRSRAALHRPLLATPGNVVLVSDLGRSEDGFFDLIEYYLDVLKTAQKHRKDINRCLCYFWMRPYILFSDDFVGFFWYDRFPETERLLSALQLDASEGQIYWDANQDWEIDVVAKDGRAHIREWDGEQDGVLIHCAKDELARQSAHVLSRTAAVVQDLKSVFGEDYWSMRNY